MGSENLQYTPGIWKVTHTFAQDNLRPIGLFQAARRLGQMRGLSLGTPVVEVRHIFRELGMRQAIFVPDFECF